MCSMMLRYLEVQEYTGLETVASTGYTSFFYFLDDYKMAKGSYVL